MKTPSQTGIAGFLVLTSALILSGCGNTSVSSSKPADGGGSPPANTSGEDTGTTTGDTGTTTGDSGTTSGDTGTTTGDNGTTTGDTGTTTGDNGATSGDTGTTTGDNSTTSGDTGTTTGDNGATSGDTGGSTTGDSGTTSGDTGTTAGDNGATSGDTGGSTTGDSGTTSGDTGTTTGDNGTTSGDTGATTGDNGTTSGDTGGTTSGDTTGGSTSDDALPAAKAPGADVSGSEDDSTTPVETASLVGPFIKDSSRGAGPPSAPTDLTLLLAAEEWLEFSWAPSSDDQSVVAYEIYRDGELIGSVRGDTDYEHDYRSWLSTSFIDCNYTRYTNCTDRQPTPGTSYSYSVIAVDNQGMRSPSSESAVFTLAQSSSDGVSLDGYQMVFNEEFTGDSLDRNRWKTALPWGPATTINGEMQYFVNVFGNNPPEYSPFRFTGDTLQITGENRPAELSDYTDLPYVSGVITTADYFRMTYGYVEMRAKVAGGDGLLSTFYLFNQDYYKNKPEIDILEYVGNRPDKAYQTYHYYDSNRARYFSGEKHSSPTMEAVTNTNLSSDYHTYGVLWEPELVVWYIDGREVRRITGPRVSDEPMNIIAHLVVGSDWIGAPDAAAIPAVFEIDYIKAWQK